MLRVCESRKFAYHSFCLHFRYGKRKNAIERCSNPSRNRRVFLSCNNYAYCPIWELMSPIIKKLLKPVFMSIWDLRNHIIHDNEQIFSPWLGFTYSFYKEIYVATGWRVVLVMNYPRISCGPYIEYSVKFLIKKGWLWKHLCYKVTFSWPWFPQNKHYKRR